MLGGGLVAGAVVLLAGEPGVGKSTLLLDVAARKAAAAGGTVLYVSGEESAGQVRLRADRIGAVHPSLLLAAETDLGAVLAHVESVRPSLLLVDSIQTIASAQIEGTPGGVSQVREVASALIQAAKRGGSPWSSWATSPRTARWQARASSSTWWTWCAPFEGEQHSTLRLLRAIKNGTATSTRSGASRSSTRVSRQ